MPGWIKIHRQFLDHWLCSEYRPLTKREAWENMLLWANYADVDVLIKGQMIKCGRGQLVYSLETLSEKFNWTIGATRHFLKLLQKDNMILVEGLKYTTRLTICNYDKYQDEQQTDNKLTTFSQHSHNKLVAAREEGKERKEEKGGKITYSEFYDSEILKSNSEENYIRIVKIIFGENEIGHRLNSVLRMRDQLSYEQAKKILTYKVKYGIVIAEVLEEMENWKDLSKRTSLYKTFLTFMKNKYPDTKKDD